MTKMPQQTAPQAPSEIKSSGFVRRLVGLFSRRKSAPAVAVDPSRFEGSNPMMATPSRRVSDPGLSRADEKLPDRSANQRTGILPRRTLSGADSVDIGGRESRQSSPSSESNKSGKIFGSGAFAFFKRLISGERPSSQKEGAKLPGVISSDRREGFMEFSQNPMMDSRAASAASTLERPGDRGAITTPAQQQRRVVTPIRRQFGATRPTGASEGAPASPKKSVADAATLAAYRKALAAYSSIAGQAPSRASISRQGDDDVSVDLGDRSDAGSPNTVGSQDTVEGFEPVSLGKRRDSFASTDSELSTYQDDGFSAERPDSRTQRSDRRASIDYGSSPLSVLERARAFAGKSPVSPVITGTPRTFRKSSASEEVAASPAPARSWAKRPSGPTKSLTSAINTMISSENNHKPFSGVLESPGQPTTPADNFPPEVSGFDDKKVPPVTERDIGRLQRPVPTKPEPESNTSDLLIKFDPLKLGPVTEDRAITKVEPGVQAVISGLRATTAEAATPSPTPPLVFKHELTNPQMEEIDGTISDGVEAVIGLVKIKPAAVKIPAKPFVPTKEDELRPASPLSDLPPKKDYKLPPPAPIDTTPRPRIEIPRNDEPEIKIISRTIPTPPKPDELTLADLGGAAGSYIRTFRSFPGNGKSSRSSKYDLAAKSSGQSPSGNNLYTIDTEVINVVEQRALDRLVAASKGAIKVSGPLTSGPDTKRRVEVRAGTTNSDLQGFIQTALRIELSERKRECDPRGEMQSGQEEPTQTFRRILAKEVELAAAEKAAKRSGASNQRAVSGASFAASVTGDHRKGSFASKVGHNQSRGTTTTRGGSGGRQS